MPRPRKPRRVCAQPISEVFGPLGAAVRAGGSMIAMTVEEYECLRLMDFEGLTQEECAQQMDVARTTVQRIYADARRKVAQSLVEGTPLRIQGGDYRLCSDPDGPDHCGEYCGRRRRGGFGRGRGSREH